MTRLLLAAFSALLLAACSCDGPAPPADAAVDAGDAGDAATPPPPPPFQAVPLTGTFSVPGLSAPAHVVRVEHDVPHIYAASRVDAMRILGFIMATDRFFQMDLTSRLSRGELSALIGDVALGSDIENRQTGATAMTDIFLAALSPEEAAEADAFAEGINAYIEAVRAGLLPPPEELRVGASFLGARRPTDLMQPWDRRAVAATGATALYGTSFETGDVGRSRSFENVASHFSGFPDLALRMAGLEEDIIEHYAPPNDASSAAGWGLDTDGTTRSPILDPHRPRRRIPLGGPRVQAAVLDRLLGHLERIDARLHRNGHEGWGSNEWAVMGRATTDGSALLAGDGHLQLSVPALFWRYGIDTVLLGDGSDDLRIVGSTIAGLPMLGVGTNGSVAWTQTAYFADVTDWYAEELVLDASGVPMATRFQGADRPLVRVDEAIEIAEVSALGSAGRTLMIPRFVTFDGRFISSIEGRPTTETEALGPGESRVNLMGDWIVPRDEDGDGTISAVSFYYGPFDGGSLLSAFRGFANATSVSEFREAMRHFIGYGGSMTAADANGAVFYSAYHAVPCRGYLPRDAGTNVWVAGADPRRLLDGTQYGAWSIPLDAQGRVDETAAAAGGPAACAVPFDGWPQALNPARGYVMNANNDPGNITTDNDLFDDPHYIGGPWIEGYRAARIEDRLQAVVAAGGADLDDMAAIQGDHHSNLGEEWVPFLLEVIAAARTAAGSSPAAGTPEARIAAAWTAGQARYTEVETRMIAWRDAGLPTPSGVETFYHTPASGDGAHAVATTIFAAWFPRVIQGVLDDEGIDRGLSPAVTGDTFSTQTIQMFVRGRGAMNPLGLGSWNPATEESVFFDDVRTTAEVESSEEIGLRALTEALAFLEAAPTGPAEGGFGTASMDAWLWGLRHQVRFESLVGGFVGDDPALDVLLGPFEIGTERFPLADPLPAGDPREGIAWFPRPGDQFDIDAANPGMSGQRFTHGSGPVFRMVIALGPDGVRGQDMLPGGQSGIPSSEFFADQALEWIANRTNPIRYLPEEVAAGAVSRQVFLP